MQDPSEAAHEETEEQFAGAHRPRPVPFFTRAGISSLPSHNVVHKWLAVQRYTHRPGAGASNRKKIYMNLYPTTTYYQVDEDVPSVAFRKFSPCGRFLIAFSRSTSIHTLEIYRVLPGVRPLTPRELSGAQAPGDEAPPGTWSHYFRLHCSVPLSQGLDTLNKDFCLFTPHSRYVIVASAQPAQQPAFSVHHAQSPEMLKSIPAPEDITLYVVDLQHGNLASKLTFATDFIHLGHNVSICIEGNRLAVLSILRQQIHLYTIRDDGTLLHLMTIGEHCHPDEALFKSRLPWLAEAPKPADLPPPTSLSSILEPIAAPLEEEQPTRAMLGGLKHRLLSTLYLQARRKGTATAIQRFYDRFPEYSSLALFKIQFLDDQHLLLRYASPEAAATRVSDPSSIYSIFVFYNFITTDVLFLTDNHSEEMLSLYESMTDYFRPAGSTMPSPMNSAPTLLQFRRTVQLTRSARNGGAEHALRRGLSALPMTSQIVRESPYFDLSLFSYDEKFITHNDRVRSCGDFPVKFFSRAHGGRAFSLPTGPKNASRSSRNRRLGSYIFHPYLPLVISVQHTIHNHSSSQTTTSSHTNLHFRG